MRTQQHRRHRHAARERPDAHGRPQRRRRPRHFQLGLGGASNLTVSLSLPVALTGPGRVNISLLDANGRVLTYGCTAANGTTASLTFTNVPQTAYVMVGSESYTGTSCSYLSNSNLTVGAYSLSLR